MSSRPRGVGEHARVRRVVLCLVATCYLAAFLSVFADYRGLFVRRHPSGQGVAEPCRGCYRAHHRWEERSARPHDDVLTPLWLHEVFGVTVDTLAESILLRSVLSATAAFAVRAAGGARSCGSRSSGVTCRYLLSGRRFSSFQWDILPLETGFLCVFLVPRRVRARSLRRRLRRFGSFASRSSSC